MPVLRSMALLGALLLGAGCQTAHAPEATEPDRARWDVTPDLQVTEWLPGVWLHTSWQVLANGSRFSSNGLLVRDGDGLLLIDTAWGEASTEALLAWTEAHLGLSVRRAFSTHWHDDRLGGAPVLERRGIPFFAHPRTRAIAEAENLPLPTPIADLAPGEAVAFGPVEVFYPGPGHSPDNTMVWLSGARLLVGGCAVKAAAAQGLGYTGDADLAAWPAALARAQAQYPEARIVVPGHGAVGDAALLAHTRALLGE